LRRNIQALDLSARSRVVTADVFEWAQTAPPPARPVDLVFLDPPYRFLHEQAEDLRQLTAALADEHLSAEAIVVFRHSADDNLDLTPLVRYDQRNYGSMTIDLLRCQSIPTNSSSPPTPPE
jgi:16S rRNA G966 N2-methylase RsmD